jgi:hypothetical protein
LSRGHVILKHIEILSRLALSRLSIQVNVVIASAPADLYRPLQVRDELTKE